MKPWVKSCLCCCSRISSNSAIVGTRDLNLFASNQSLNLREQYDEPTIKKYWAVDLVSAMEESADSGPNFEGNKEEELTLRPDVSNAWADNDSEVVVIDEMESFEMRDGSAESTCKKHQYCHKEHNHIPKVKKHAQLAAILST
jgi:hypothetical protein